MSCSPFVALTRPLVLRELSAQHAVLLDLRHGVLVCIVAIGSKMLHMRIHYTLALLVSPLSIYHSSPI